MIKWQALLHNYYYFKSLFDPRGTNKTSKPLLHIYKKTSTISYFAFPPFLRISLICSQLLFIKHWSRPFNDNKKNEVAFKIVAASPEAKSAFKTVAFFFLHHGNSNVCLQVLYASYYFPYLNK